MCELVYLFLNFKETWCFSVKSFWRRWIVIIIILFRHISNVLFFWGLCLSSFPSEFSWIIHGLWETQSFVMFKSWKQCNINFVGSIFLLVFIVHRVSSASECPSYTNYAIGTKAIDDFSSVKNIYIIFNGKVIQVFYYSSYLQTFKFCEIYALFWL